MGQVEQLSYFFNSIIKDSRVSPTHICIYASLLHYQTMQDGNDPIRAYSYEIMKVAKLSTRFSLLKGLKALDEMGYIRFVPTRNRKARSKIYITSGNKKQ